MCLFITSNAFERSQKIAKILENVTILFSYLLGFNEMISKVGPLQLVECINSVFVVFDATVDKYDVFKVETLGDAVYMVAGGILEPDKPQTDSVAAVALEFVEKVKYIPIPDDNQSLQLRAGMHTGSVVAGVVGKRMPQYCLFGDTVNTASRMQTYSEPGCIHISEPCQKYLRGTEYVTMSRGKVNIKVR
ncbi:hypothetical protein LSH36_654g00025 [Paralvinella palmiformis]|uniref:Guanylate cyclase domain-containing protein n=1 Tax=Paralvinella palmiformis TaxID=53620 RepID=A0AAD9J4R3_9ANNE|nr:hypothetical protein LSH36_654g00025 [Paralvinella palmiformis]